MMKNEPHDQSAGSTHRIRLLTESEVGLPVSSRAGVKRALLRMIRHTVWSRAAEPLDEVISQLVTRPSGPMLSRKPVVPCCSARIAEAG
jgi:hypothetical protein